METTHIVARAMVGDWVVSIEETIDNQTATLFDRSFLCSKPDSSGKEIVEYFDSLIETVEFARSFSTSPALSRWDTVARMGRQADEYYLAKGIKL